MKNTPDTSSAPAAGYPLNCGSEDFASASVTTQDRREDITLLPGHGTSSGPLVSAGSELRPYQAAAVQSLRQALAGGAKRLMLCAPTGSGKTEIAIAMIKGALARRKRVIFLCNRIQLVQQTSRRLNRSGIDHGVIQGENTARIYENVLNASIQTVARRGMPPADLLIIDEAHAVAGSKDFRRVMLQSACPVIGLSATPFSSGLGRHYAEVGGPLFEGMVVAAKISELITDGYLVPCDIYAPSEPDMSRVKKVRNSFGEMDYSDADAGLAADKPALVGDIVQHWLKLAGGTPTVCFAASIAHSEHIVARFIATGVKAEHLDCYTPEEERQAILQRIESGETKVISNVGILAEGWDFPACCTLILARPTRSLIRYLQMAGRVLRPHPGKQRALILDHSGTVLRLGFPTDEFPLVLDDGVTERCATRKEREMPLPNACPSCSHVKPAGLVACPVCGFAPKKQPGVVTTGGRLVLQRPEARKIGKQAFFSQLIAIAAARQYRKGWIKNVFFEYFGIRPKGLKQVAEEPTKAVLDFVKHRQIRYARGKAKGHGCLQG